MMYSKKTMDKIFRFFLFFAVSLQLTLFSIPDSGASELEGIFSEGDSPSLRLQVSEKISSKVILVDNKEVLIALKNIRPAQGMKLQIKSSKLFKMVEIEELSGNVLAVLVTGQVPFEKAVSVWDDKGLNLAVSFMGKADFVPSPSTTGKSTSVSGNGKPGNAASGAAAAKLSSGQAGKAEPAGSSTQTTQNRIQNSGGKSDTSSEKQQDTDALKNKIDKKAYGSRKNRISGMTGDISGMVLQADLMQCSDDDLKKASLLLKQFQWNNAHELLNGYIENGGKKCPI